MIITFISKLTSSLAKNDYLFSCFPGIQLFYGEKYYNDHVIIFYVLFILDFSISNKKLLMNIKVQLCQINAECNCCIAVRLCVLSWIDVQVDYRFSSILLAFLPDRLLQQYCPNLLEIFSQSSLICNIHR